MPVQTRGLSALLLATCASHACSESTPDSEAGRGGAGGQASVASGATSTTTLGGASGTRSTGAAAGVATGAGRSGAAGAVGGGPTGGMSGTSSGGVAGAAGRSGAAGADTGGSSGGAAGAPTGGARCKRGIAANTAPGAAFFPAVAWWYNWAMQSTGTNVGIEFVPMMWGSNSVSGAIPGGSKYLLTFNEPNFHEQSNLTAQQAASYWPTIEAKAGAANLPIVGPGMNFCGPAANCNGTDPYQYLKDFFAACSGCKVDYVAVHWYNCDLPSLRDYLEPGGNLEGFEQFGKPIWLTEFSCDGQASVAAQEAYMRLAIPYLESNPHVFRYSWFSADPIPSAKLINADGSPTALGRAYIELGPSCP